MTDFGGILDSIRGTVTDASSFFDSGIVSALARGVVGGESKNTNSKISRYNKLEQAYRLANMYNVPDNAKYSPASDEKFKANKSEDYNDTLANWMSRMRIFSQIDSDVTAGKVAEGKPQ